MSLLFDANLSPDLYPNSEHVLFCNLGPARTDEAVWAFAIAGALTIVTKDADFYAMSALKGAPP
jgi:predicted nuclease of predicted toxin-antitoxin system